MKVVKSFSLDAKLLSEVEDLLVVETETLGEHRSIHQFVEDAMRRELDRTQKRIQKAGED